MRVADLQVCDEIRRFVEPPPAPLGAGKLRRAGAAN